jgi:hypothetical protein
VEDKNNGETMSIVIKRNLKSWMLVYACFVVALTATNFAVDAESDLALVSPGSLPAKFPTEQKFFRPAVAQPSRSDI